MEIMVVVPANNFVGCGEHFFSTWQAGNWSLHFGITC
jgi:hypothetical protein